MGYLDFDSTNKSIYQILEPASDYFGVDLELFGCFGETLNRTMPSYFTVMNNNVAVEEEPVRNGIKNIELRDLKSIGYQKVPYDDEFGDMTKLKADQASISSTNSSLSSGQHVQMKKGVGLLSGVALIVGTMIGKCILVKMSLKN